MSFARLKGWGVGCAPLMPGVGRLHVLMEEGQEFDNRPGDVSTLPSGHDAWVVGDEELARVASISAPGGVSCCR